MHRIALDFQYCFGWSRALTWRENDTSKFYRKIEYGRMRKVALKTYIKNLGILNHVYIGKNFLKKNRSIGIYSSKHSHTYRAIVDKKKMNGYSVKFITLLVHWNKSQEETELVSKRVYKALLTASEVNGIKLMYPLVPEPIDVGSDSKGIYEMIIEVAVVYQPWWKFQ